MAKARALKDGISYDEALRLVARENPNLVSQERRNVTRAGVSRHTKGTASDEMARMATAKAKEKGINYRTALSEVGPDAPELSRRYQREIGRED